MRTIPEQTTKSQAGATTAPEQRQLPLDDGTVPLAMIQALIPLGLRAVEEALQREVTALREAERRAKLPKLAGGLWHPYRRGWASERMHFPLKAVADAGGWKDVTTLVRCYQQTDERTLLAVMANAQPGRTRRNEARPIAS